MTVRSPQKYRLRIDIGSARDVISWYVLLSVFTGAEFWVGYINPKIGVSRAFVSLHFCSMRWCYILNCVYYISGSYGLQLWLDPYDYEHLIWPRLLLYYMWLMMWYTGLYTYNSELLNHLYWTYLLRVPTALALHLHPRTKRIFSEYVYNWCPKWDPWTLNIITMENGTIAPLLGGDFGQSLPSSPSGEVSMGAFGGRWLLC